MSRLIILTTVCFALASAAFAQGAFGNAIAAASHAAPALEVRPAPNCTNVSEFSPCAPMTAITIRIPYEIELPNGAPGGLPAPQNQLTTTACSDLVQSNLTVNVGGLNSFDGAGICVAPPA
ncbi:MAG: hypothetical protein ABSG65_25675 [Bryobacteraceae bacterium]